MNGIFTGVLFGGAVGSAVAAAQVARAPHPDESSPTDPSANGSSELGRATASRLARGALEGAAVGGFVGLMMNRRSRRRAEATLAVAPVVVEWARKAAPVVESAVERALPVLESAFDAARERTREAAEVAREKVAELRPTG